MLKHLLYLTTTGAALLGSAFAEQTDLWAAGVSREHGWRDYNKNFDGRDDELCWAITATNLIDWWQAQMADKLPPNTPQGADIMPTFVASFSNAGSDPDEGLRWWFTGGYTPGRSDCAALQEGHPGGYLRSLLPPDTEVKGSLLHAMRGSQVTAETATEAFISGARAGAAFWIGVSYVSPAGRPAMHSLNVWGVRCTTNDHGDSAICGIWIADSDDGRTGLTYVPLKEDQGMLIFNATEHPIYKRIPRIVIDTITTLKPAHSSDDSP